MHAQDKRETFYIIFSRKVRTFLGFENILAGPHNLKVIFKDFILRLTLELVLGQGLSWDGKG